MHLWLVTTFTRIPNIPQLEAIWELLPYHISVVHVANVALRRHAATIPLLLGGMPAAEPTVPQYFISSRF